MRKLRWVLWLGGLLACGGDDAAPQEAGAGPAAGQAGEAGAQAGAGASGQGGAGAGAQGGAGQAGAGKGGAGQGGAGATPGSAGAGQGGAGAGGAGQGGAGSSGQGSQPQGGAGSAGQGAGQGGAGQAGVSAGQAGKGGAGQGGAEQAGSGQGGAGQGGGLPARPFDWVGLIGTGQSLSVGASTGPALEKIQPYANRMLVDASGVAFAQKDDQSAALSLAPLAAPMRSITAEAKADYTKAIYPNNLHGETPGEGMANQLSALSLATEGRDFTSLYSAVGAGGRYLYELVKGGAAGAFEGSLFEAKAMARLAKEAGKVFGVGAVVLTHGEGDHSTPNYGEGVYQLYLQYNDEIPKITGQKEKILVLLSQQHSLPGDPNQAATSTIQQWQVGVDHPGEVLCVGPKYQYEYADYIGLDGQIFFDRIHMRSAGYRRLGEKNAEVYWRVAELGEAWKPLQPAAVSRKGKVISLQLHVPDPPLSWDPHMAPPHAQPGAVWGAWAKGKGFEVAQSNPTAALVIDDVTIQGSAVDITLADEPTGAEVFLSYALFQEPSEPVPPFNTQPAAGTAAGRHGLLRDSDPFVGRDAEVIDCLVEQGSAEIHPATPGAFEARSLWDVVTADGLAKDTAVVGKKGLIEGQAPAPDVLVLSSPWQGPSGLAKLHFAYNQRNYLVAFRLPVPVAP